MRGKWTAGDGTINICADIQNCSTYSLAQLAICSLCGYTELQHVQFGTTGNMQFVQIYRTAARTVWHSWQYAVCADIQNCSTYSSAQRLLYGASNMQFVRNKLTSWIYYKKYSFIAVQSIESGGQWSASRSCRFTPLNRECVGSGLVVTFWRR